MFLILCVMFLLSGPGFFVPQGRHSAPIIVKFGTGSKPAVRSHLPNFAFIGAKMWEYSPKTVEISNFGHKFVPQRRLVCTVFTK